MTRTLNNKIKGNKNLRAKGGKIFRFDRLAVGELSGWATPELVLLLEKPCFLSSVSPEAPNC